MERKRIEVEENEKRETNLSVFLFALVRKTHKGFSRYCRFSVPHNKNDWLFTNIFPFISFSSFSFFFLPRLYEKMFLSKCRERICVVKQRRVPLFSKLIPESARILSVMAHKSALTVTIVPSSPLLHPLFNEILMSL